MLDTGIDARHPALRERVAEFLFVDEAGIARPERRAFDDDGHGTHTAALICGASVRGRAAVGVALTARLYCAAVLDEGMVPVRLLVGLHWLATRPIRVLHMPLGIVGKTPLLRDALARLRRRGILTVAAVGNDGSGRFDTPGCYPEVLSVGACDRRREPAVFSGSYYPEGRERCLKPDVLAPGVDIRSAASGGGFVRCSGTSMASATVAGIAARLFAARPEATPSEVESAIVRSARALDRSLRHRSRHGIVDLEAALELFQGGECRRRPPRPPMCWSGKTRCDPLLRRRLEFRLSGEQLQAIVSLHPSNPGGQALVRLVAAHARACRQRAHQLRLLPGARSAIVIAHHRVIRRLLRDERIAFLHSTELDIVRR